MIGVTCQILTPAGVPRSPFARVRIAVLVIFCALLVATPLSAQSSGNGFPVPAAPGSIAGRVIDAGSGMPLRAAQVYIEAVRPRMPELSDEEEGVRVRGVAIMLTNAAGEYAFNDLRPGRYRVNIQTPGYRHRAIDVELTGHGDVQVTIGLEFAPVILPPVEVTSEPRQSFARTSSFDLGDQAARRLVVIDRQQEFLGSDVRSITAGDVRDAITFAEPDLFRAIQRMPGVTRRDDYTAVLWTRGAPWVHTRVNFDGMPLFNPTHGGWLFSSVNPDGVGSAIFQPGIRSVAIGEGAAGVLDLQSRRSAGDAWLNMSSELSLASVRLSADGRVPGGATWLVAGRRTYVDMLTRAWERFGDNPDAHIPYDFSDLIARVDVPLPGGLSVEASSLIERDRLRGDIRDFLDNNRAAWGNQVNQVTARLELGSVVFSGSVGGTRFNTDVEQIGNRSVNDEDVPTLSELRNTIDHDRISVRLDGAPVTPGGLGWSFGFERIKEELTYEGPFSHTGEGLPGLNLEISPYTLAMDNAYDAGWAEFRFAPIRSVDFQAGVRVESGDSLIDLGGVRVAPRFSVRWQPTPSSIVSAGWGRSFQYSQAIGASGGPLGPQLHIGNLWILSNIGFPALRSEIFVAGAEHWLSRDWLLTANSYRREVDGIREPDPTPGRIRPDAVSFTANQVARGFEISARKLAGNWTAMLGYAYGDATTEVLEFRYPSQGDIRHTFDATGGYRLAGGLRIGAAFAYSTGLPYTRILIEDIPALGDPNAHRTPAYVGFDMVFDYATRVNDWEVEVYAQLLNVFNRANRITYSGSRCNEAWTPRLGVGNCSQAGVFDELKAGLPRLPLIGMRVAF